MSYEAAHSFASSWAVLFAAVWFARNAHRIEETARLEHAEQLGRRARSGRQRERRNRRRFLRRPGDFPGRTDVGSRATGRGGDDQPNAEAATKSNARWHVPGQSVQVVLDNQGPSRSERVDPAVTRPGRTGSRFDQTVALPIDAPWAMEATIRDLVLRLKALPELHELSRRSAPYRVQLERTLAEARSARRRLANGSYGVCTACSAPISLAVLTEKPWAPTCIHCDLNI